MRCGFSERLAVIRRDVAALIQPFVRVGEAGAADYGENMDQRDETRALHRALRRRAVPEVREDMAVVEGHHHLGCLVVCRSMTKIAALRQLRHLPVPARSEEHTSELQSR